MGQKKASKASGNKYLLYGGVLLAAMVAFVGVYAYTGGDFTKLAGAAIDCGDKTATPTLEITDVKDGDLTVEVTVKVDDDCGLAKLERTETLYRLEDGKLVRDLILGNEDLIAEETTFTKTYSFSKTGYQLSGGEVKIEFTAYDVSGAKQSVATDNFKI